MTSLQPEESSLKPKYLQIADAILKEIEDGKLKLNDRLPSVNQLSSMAQVSRETVFKALNHLSEKGIIQSANRKGYFVMKTDVDVHMRIFFLLDKFTPFKEKLYHSFKRGIGEKGEVDIYFHHHNIKIFQSLINQNLSQYTHFVIVTFLNEEVSSILNQIPAPKRLILDSYEPELTGDYYMVYQDFKQDIMKSLEILSDRLKHYKRLIAIAPGSLFHAAPVIEGLEEFSLQSGFPTQIKSSIDPEDFRSGDVYLTLTAYDLELVEIIKLSRKHKLAIGKEIGIISYNDTPVKEVLAGGITVITTDFNQMGVLAAELLKDKKPQIVANPTKLIRRKTL